MCLFDSTLASEMLLTNACFLAHGEVGTGVGAEAVSWDPERPVLSPTSLWTEGVLGPSDLQFPHV